MRVLSLLFFLRLCAVVSSALATDLSNPVMEIQSGNFDSHMKSGYRYFIKFFAPWCTYCKRLKSTWETLATTVGGNDALETRIAEVDCTKYADICTKVGVKGYPTLMYADGKSSELYKYSGGMTLETFTEMIEQQLESNSVTSGDNFTLTKQGSSSAQPRGRSSSKAKTTTSSSSSSGRSDRDSGTAGKNAAAGGRKTKSNDDPISLDDLAEAVGIFGESFIGFITDVESLWMNRVVVPIRESEMIRNFIAGNIELDDEAHWKMIQKLYLGGFVTIAVVLGSLFYFLPKCFAV
ncbi:unnamed protein product [Amoebophrya sp. A120]|nr:unnamed protein product [Amoebophrya sp. A120]|eukprot:GSA120T00011559001.1